MTITLDIRPEIEAELAATARAWSVRRAVRTAGSGARAGIGPKASCRPNPRNPGRYPRRDPRQTPGRRREPARSLHPRRPQERRVSAVFADTFYWIAPINPGDRYSREVERFDDLLSGGNVYTTEEVLVEVLTFFAADAWLRNRAFETVREMTYPKRQDGP
jgi:hypothetical protein